MGLLGGVCGLGLVSSVIFYLTMVFPRTPAVPAPAGDEHPSFDAQAFFEAIPSDRERAVAMLRTQVPTDGPVTPRAAAYINNGEWDQRSLLSLRFVPAEACTGRVGVVLGDAE